MSVYKDTKNNTWKVYFRFTDWQGKVYVFIQPFARSAIFGSTD